MVLTSRKSVSSFGLPQFKALLLQCLPCKDVGENQKEQAESKPKPKPKPKPEPVPVCANCNGNAIVYKDREGAFANLDGKGDFDIWTCPACTGSHVWLECSHDPTRRCKTIVKRGDREPCWFEFGRKRKKSVEACDTTLENFLSGTASRDAVVDRHKTRFASLRLHCEKARLDTDSVDFGTKEFFDAAEIVVEILKMFGAIASRVLADVEKNLVGARSSYEDEPETRTTLRRFLIAELRHGLHKPGPPQSCKLKDPSGAMQLQWLLRGLEFIALYLVLLFRDEPNAVHEAYSRSLLKYHGFMISSLFKSALTAMPDRKRLCSIRELCSADTDACHLEALILRDGLEAAQSLLETVRGMIDLCQEFQLWDAARV
eukprot:TRINITY_DN18568_c2_g2_i4.p1 TRINITY_DN18568_c2_g2~~TRINITY_DN18568_c2_g2_i4.p1  ORF type:complete len:411 (+),score=82.56 TRINITY_DN18568_c2_g2_i4:116-1234(+)